eukprot:1288167-Rhodomonas_salina.1
MPCRHTLSQHRTASAHAVSAPHHHAICQCRTSHSTARHTLAQYRTSHSTCFSTHSAIRYISTGHRVARA